TCMFIIINEGLQMNKNLITNLLKLDEQLHQIKEAGIALDTISRCNPPEKSQQLFIENSIKINSRSFLCVNQNSLIARYWRSSNKMKMVCPFQSSVESMA